MHRSKAKSLTVHFSRGEQHVCAVEGVYIIWRERGALLLNIDREAILVVDHLNKYVSSRE